MQSVSDGLDNKRTLPQRRLLTHRVIAVIADGGNAAFASPLTSSKETQETKESKMGEREPLMLQLLCFKLRAGILYQIMMQILYKVDLRVDHLIQKINRFYFNQSLT